MGNPGDQVRPRQQVGNVRPPKFLKVAPTFDSRSPDPTIAEHWMNKVEKAFTIYEMPDQFKVPLAEFQLKMDTNNWWTTKKLNVGEPITWILFRQLFYERYFPQATRNKMMS